MAKLHYSRVTVRHAFYWTQALYKTSRSGLNWSAATQLLLTSTCRECLVKIGSSKMRVSSIEVGCILQDRRINLHLTTGAVNI